MKEGNRRRREAIDDPELWKFFRPDGRLERMPASRALRRRLLERLASRFERDREYPESEVNVALSAVHNDFASLRRALVDEAVLRRDHGSYRRA